MRGVGLDRIGDLEWLATILVLGLDSSSGERGGCSSRLAFHKSSSDYGHIGFFLFVWCGDLAVVVCLCFVFDVGVIGFFLIHFVCSNCNLCIYLLLSWYWTIMVMVRAITVVFEHAI